MHLEISYTKLQRKLRHVEQKGFVSDRLCPVSATASSRKQFSDFLSKFNVYFLCVLGFS